MLKHKRAVARPYATTTIKARHFPSSKDPEEQSLFQQTPLHLLKYSHRAKITACPKYPSTYQTVTMVAQLSAGVVIRADTHALTQRMI